jgi:hypothetical protein
LSAAFLLSYLLWLERSPDLLSKTGLRIGSAFRISVYKFDLHLVVSVFLQILVGKRGKLLCILWVCRGAVIGWIGRDEKFYGFHGHTPVRFSL